MIDAQREQLNAAIERARIHALEHFGKAEPVGKSPPMSEPSPPKPPARKSARSAVSKNSITICPKT